MQYPIVIWPAPILSAVAKPIEWVPGVDGRDLKMEQYLDKLTSVMAAAMIRADGLGIAAQQIGEPYRVIISVDKDDPKHQLHTFINPEIVEHHEEVDSLREGCLSLPGERFDMVRWKKIRMKYQDEEGKPQEMLAEGYFAIELQHEVDHLNGKLLIDQAKPLRRMMVRDAMNVIKRRQKKFGDTWNSLEELGGKLLASAKSA